MNIQDEYTAFCFDEACNEIEEMMCDKNCPSPQFVVNYGSFSELYSKYENQP